MEYEQQPDLQPGPRQVPRVDLFKLLYRVLASAASVYVADYLLDKITLTDFWGAIWVALLLGILNVLVKPLLMLISLPLIVFSFGLFLLVINAVLLLVVSDLTDVLDVQGFWTAVLGALIITLVTTILNPPKRRDGGGGVNIHINMGGR